MSRVKPAVHSCCYTHDSPRLDATRPMSRVKPAVHSCCYIHDSPRLDATRPMSRVKPAACVGLRPILIRFTVLSCSLYQLWQFNNAYFQQPQGSHTVADTCQVVYTLTTNRRVITKKLLTCGIFPVSCIKSIPFIEHNYCEFTVITNLFFRINVIVVTLATTQTW